MGPGCAQVRQPDYKGSTAGTWWLREYCDGKRPKRRLGLADDGVEAGGPTVFSWSQVLIAALGGDRPTLGTLSTYTVEDALADYWRYRAAKSPALSVQTDKCSRATSGAFERIGVGLRLRGGHVRNRLEHS